jgi:hypothetical protein
MSETHVGIAAAAALASALATTASCTTSTSPRSDLAARSAVP